MNGSWLKSIPKPVFLLGWCFLCVGLLGADRPKGLGDVEEIRTWSYPDYTRVVVELTRPVTLPEDPVVRLGRDDKGKRPERLYIDIPGIWVGREYKEGVPVGDGLLQAVRLGQNTLQTTRMVIDLERYDRHRMFSLSSPDRIVVDVYGNRDEEKTAQARTKPSQSAKKKEKKKGAPRGSRLPMGSRTIQRVVIDPGHGGKDPGAIGVGGAREKDVNLRLAKMLAARLRARSFDVVMTREDDRYLNLEERTAMAESVRGDLFISIHANASRNRSLRGIEIYYLDEDHKRHNLEVAARENGVRPSEVDSLQRALSKLRVSEASRHSRMLAEVVHEDITEGLGSTYGDVSDLGVKKGPFYVLFMSSMPSILVETGFLTNRQDARLLASDRYLDTLAAQIAAGLGHYRNQGRQRTASTRREEKTR